MNLKCAACGCQATTFHQEPSLGVHVYQAAVDIHWQPVIDTTISTVAVFCDAECRDANLTKKGFLRLKGRKNPKGNHGA